MAYRQRKQISGRLARLEAAAAKLPHPETDEELAQRFIWTVDYLTISGVIVVNTAGRWQVRHEYASRPDHFNINPGWQFVADMMNQVDDYRLFAERVAGSGEGTYTLPHPSGCDVVFNVEPARVDDSEHSGAGVG